MGKAVFRQVEMQQLIGLIEEVFAKGGTFTFAPSGRSMLPMLREGKDTVRLCCPAQRIPQKYDVILYRRENGKYVLHRIIGQDAAGFILCGDGQFIVEKGIRADQILGVLCGFTRKTAHKTQEISVNSYGYRCYAVAWVFLRPIRGLIIRVIRKLRRRIGK